MTQRWDAANYAREGAFVHQMATGVVEWLGLEAGERLLDLGCGEGTLAAQFAAAGAAVTAIDASAEMVAATRARGVDTREASAEELPFAAENFDVVFSNAVLHWVRDHERMLDEVRRVLRPGGRFVAECGGQGNIAAIVVALRAVLARYGLEQLEDAVNYYPSVPAYGRRLARHGFQVERMELIPRPTPLPESGMKGWLETFRRGVLEQVDAGLRGQIVDETVALLRPALCDEDGNWTADYVRLRFVARRR